MHIVKLGHDTPVSMPGAASPAGWIVQLLPSQRSSNGSSDDAPPNPVNPTAVDPTAVQAVAELHDTAANTPGAGMLPAGVVCVSHCDPVQRSAIGSKATGLVPRWSPTALHAVADGQATPSMKPAPGVLNVQRVPFQVSTNG
jgi:hypothetical protein